MTEKQQKMTPSSGPPWPNGPLETLIYVNEQPPGLRVAVAATCPAGCALTPDPDAALLTVRTQNDAVLFEGAETISLSPPQPFAIWQRLLTQAATTARQHAWHQPFHVGPWRIEPASQTAQAGHQIVTLAARETALLVYLAHQAPAAVSGQALAEVLWQHHPETDSHTVTTHIYQLRQKLERDPGQPQLLLTNEHGYKLALSSAS